MVPIRNSKLKLILFEQGMTQRKLSSVAGVPESYISLAINGRFNFDSEQRRRISIALGRNERELFPSKER